MRDVSNYPFCEVAVDLSAEATDKAFIYSIPDGMKLNAGQRVAVPFGSRIIDGIVLRLKDDTDIEKDRIKNVNAVLEEEPCVDSELMELASWMSVRYHSTLVSALRLMIPSDLRKGSIHPKTVRYAELCASDTDLPLIYKKLERAPKQCEIIRILETGSFETSELFQKTGTSNAQLRVLAQKGIIRISEKEVFRKPYEQLDNRMPDTPELTSEQAYAVDRVKKSMDGDAQAFLLFGVTGSGKTEVYIQTIRYALNKGKTAIMLVPEIALTPQIVDMFRSRFGKSSAVLHSRLSSGERYDEWRRIKSGEARVVIGARSAVFAPVKDLGIIVIDEEHEQSYKSESRPRYDAREVAKWRTVRNSAVLLLGSATPDLASYMKTMPRVRPENKLELLELSERVNRMPLPVVEIVDMSKELARGNSSVFSASLRDALEDRIKSGEQSMLLINHRGYSTFVSCRMCGSVEKCDNCDVSMTYHRTEGLLRCHYCGAVKLPPKTCPKCGSKLIKYFGIGTQKVEEELHDLFPSARVARMDLDTTREKDAHERILTSFRNKEIDILTGTQMIAKGHDFPNVTLVGIMAADMMLNIPDYRSQERTFQLLTQAAGRAGRAEKPGRVIIQTYDPDSYAIKCAARQDYRAFYNTEKVFRKRGLYPPYTMMSRILISGQDGEATKELAMGFEKELNDFLDQNDCRKNVVQMRALEAPISLINGDYRWQVFIKTYASADNDLIFNRMEEMSRRIKRPLKAELEINPANMF